MSDNIFPDQKNPTRKKTPEQRITKQLSDRLKLFTAGNPKLMKGVKKGYLPMVLMLAPAYLSGWEVCPFRSPGCTRACLNTAGRGGMSKGGALSPEQVIKISNTIQQARLRRTKLLYSQTSDNFNDRPRMPEEFSDLLLRDIDTLLKFAGEKGFTPCVRLNGTSDLRWEQMPIGKGMGGRNVFERFPGVQFYDYTKHPLRNRKKIPKNYHLTYSLTEQAISGRRMREWFTVGVNTAVVFSTKRGRPLPPEHAGYDVIDGDMTDLHFLDPPGVIVGLRAKGFAQADSTGFVIDADTDQANPPQLDFEGGDLFPDLDI